MAEATVYEPDSKGTQECEDAKNAYLDNRTIENQQRLLEACLSENEVAQVQPYSCYSYRFGHIEGCGAEAGASDDAAVCARAQGSADADPVIGEPTDGKGQGASAACGGDMLVMGMSSPQVGLDEIDDATREDILSQVDLAISAHIANVATSFEEFCDGQPEPSAATLCDRTTGEVIARLNSALETELNKLGTGESS